MTTVEAGWYADPEDATRWRWWDGEGWTEHTTGALDDPPSDAVVDEPAAPPVDVHETAHHDDVREPEAWPAGPAVTDLPDDDRTRLVDVEPPERNDGRAQVVDTSPVAGAIAEPPPFDDRPVSRVHAPPPASPFSSPTFWVLMVLVVAAGLALGFFVIG